MSGPGDIDGEVSGDEAAWRDLIARFDIPADAAVTDPPWPSSEDLPEASALDAEQTATLPASADAADGDPAQADSARADAADADPAAAADPVSRRERPGGPSSVYLPSDRIRVIRPAGDPRSYSPAEEEDEPYVPAPLPPPARLDPIAKAAWVGVIGGPGYLLVVSLFLHMAVSATAAFVAVAAFVGGFVTLVVKLGDNSRRDDDDDGAVL